MKLRLNVGYDAIALLSYETAHAIGIKLECDDSYAVMQKLIDRDFGEKVKINESVERVASLIDNKITACYSNTKQMLFVTYWDGNIYIGSQANIFNDFTKIQYAYRCQPPRHLNLDGIGTAANLLRHWKDYQSI